MRILLLVFWLLIGTGTSAFAADTGPSATFFPVLPFEAPDNALPQYVPVASNHPLDGDHKGITRAIIFIHDNTRNASGALTTLSSLAGEANNATIIVAPQFLLPSDVTRSADRLPNKGQDFAAWQMADWADGDDSVSSPAHKGISSYTVLDLLLMYLTDNTAFPDMQTITVAGVGSGANFVQRYAAFGVAAKVLSKQNLNVRFIVADASSYLYQTSNRPLQGKKGFGSADAATCPDFNAYPYGLEKLNPYTARVGANAAKINYASRFITYLNAPAADASPETSCAALQQGADSASRAVNYQDYLQSIYGALVAKNQNFSVVKAKKNDTASLLGSVCGMEVLFGEGLCPTVIEATP